jgi:hypothetical protein
MPATTRRLLGLWSFAFACCAIDFVYNYLTRSRRMNAWGMCKGMQPWLGVSAAAIATEPFFSLNSSCCRSASRRVPSKWHSLSRRLTTCLPTAAIPRPSRSSCVMCYRHQRRKPVPVTLLNRYLFASISEGSILTVCLLVSKGHLLMTNHLSIAEKKQVVFVGLWLCIRSPLQLAKACPSH